MKCRNCGKEFDPETVWYNQEGEDEDLAVLYYGLCDECAYEAECGGWPDM